MGPRKRPKRPDRKGMMEEAESMEINSKAVAIMKGEPPGRMAGGTGADPRTTGTKEGGTVETANSGDASTVVKDIVWTNVLYVPPQREAGFYSCHGMQEGGGWIQEGSRKFQEKPRKPRGRKKRLGS